MKFAIQKSLEERHEHIPTGPRGMEVGVGERLFHFLRNRDTELSHQTYQITGVTKYLLVKSLYSHMSILFVTSWSQKRTR